MEVGWKDKKGKTKGEGKSMKKETWPKIAKRTKEFILFIFFRTPIFLVVMFGVNLLLILFGEKKKKS